jgi:hypothetical protein
MKADLEKQLEKDARRHRDENLQALPSWAQTAPLAAAPTLAPKSVEKKRKKGKKKK